MNTIELVAALRSRPDPKYASVTLALQALQAIRASVPAAYADVAKQVDDAAADWLLSQIMGQGVPQLDEPALRRAETQLFEAYMARFDSCVEVFGTGQKRTNKEQSALLSFRQMVEILLGPAGEFGGADAALKTSLILEREATFDRSIWTKAEKELS